MAHTDIRHPPIDPVFDIYRSARGPFTQSQLLLLFVQLSGKERQPRNLGSPFIILMIVDFAGAHKFRAQMGVRDARCLHDPTPASPAGPRPVRREGAEAELGEGKGSMTCRSSSRWPTWIPGALSSTVVKTEATATVGWGQAGGPFAVSFPRRTGSCV